MYTMAHVIAATPTSSPTSTIFPIRIPALMRISYALCLINRPKLPNRVHVERNFSFGAQSPWLACGGGGVLSKLCESPSNLRSNCLNRAREDLGDSPG